MKMVINSQISVKVALVSYDGLALNDDYKKVNITKTSGLKAAEKYKSQNEDIKALLDEYGTLLSKDCIDVQKTISSFNTMDSLLNSNIMAK
ncbi:hypothetical protein [Coprococcus eutactus]|jgi:hypothetical protein|uniref:hypothetical protein n=1 Tax=Coprococcus eutactus TaxID=33043 RepID=UPI00156F484D|nr:hypothetical protein [Coprococcus eutactus]NSE72303.1 hypothetical protein [Coprococcus eutactus]